MRTIESVMTWLTEPKTLLREVRETLKSLDPEYPAEEETFLLASAQLEMEMEHAGEYLEELERSFAAELVYVGWLGFQFNLDCFESPVNKLLLDEDFEELYRERRMHILPAVASAGKNVDTFVRTMPPEQRRLTEDIAGYYAYLETVALKLAHCFGFRLGDAFFYHVIPGYAHDSTMSDRYTQTLRDYLCVEPSGNL